MKDEIKEILVRSKEQQALDDLKALANAKEDEEVYIEYGLNTKARILLDYITNLQEENKRLKELNENASKVCIAEHKYGVEKAEEARDYKSRNEKAIEDIDLVIELIKQQPTEDDTWILNRLNGFKYLLQGSDKDE